VLKAIFGNVGAYTIMKGLGISYLNLVIEIFTIGYSYAKVFILRITKQCTQVWTCGHVAGWS